MKYKKNRWNTEPSFIWVKLKCKGNCYSITNIHWLNESETFGTIKASIGGSTSVPKHLLKVISPHVNEWKTTM
jgi:hypothetical protein